MGNKLTGKDLIKLGFPKNNAINIALGQINRYRKKDKKDHILKEAKEVLLNPEKFKMDGTWGKVAEGLVNPVQVRMHQLMHTRAPFQIFGENEIDEQAKFQLYDALKLPVSVAGALMPDAHSGYGLPIGEVLATDNAIIPYGVGVDIGCRMSLSIFDLPASFLKGKDFQLQNILKENTKFGMSETHEVKADHEVF
jgi:tRNA-splicing ligase RtcB (3'-phosphate/5'-hydroxy nucleic acid ligase)